MLSEGSWSALRSILAVLAATYAGNNAALHAQLTQAINDLNVIVPAAVSLVTVGIGVYKNWNTKKVPSGTAALIIGAMLVLGGLPAFAADLITPTTTAAKPAACQSSGNCSGWYASFGLVNSANFASGINASNGVEINVGGGYQLWSGQWLAAIEAMPGYQFASSGASQSGGNFTGTEFVKLGYNFFPSSQTAAPTSAQNPFLGPVPANLLAASTPYIIAGGVQRHGITEGAVGAGVETVIASGWSTAFDYYNAPTQKGQADTNVFRISVQKHF